jgi:hypothetical protein
MSDTSDAVDRYTANTTAQKQSNNIGIPSHEVKTLEAMAQT